LAMGPKHLAQRGGGEQAAVGALDLLEVLALPGIERLRGARAWDVDGVTHQSMRFGIHARYERGGVDASDGRKDGMMRCEDDAALAQGGQPRHDLRGHIVRTEAVDDDNQMRATGDFLCSG